MLHTISDLYDLYDLWHLQIAFASLTCRWCSWYNCISWRSTLLKPLKMAASMSTCVCSNHLNVSSSLEKWNITGPRCTEFFLDLVLKKRLLWYEVLLIYKLHNLLRQSTRYRHYYHSHHKRRNRCISVTYQCKGTLCTSRKKWIYPHGDFWISLSSNQNV